MERPEGLDRISRDPLARKLVFQLVAHFTYTKYQIMAVLRTAGATVQATGASPPRNTLSLNPLVTNLRGPGRFYIAPWHLEPQQARGDFTTAVFCVTSIHKGSRLSIIPHGNFSMVVVRNNPADAQPYACKA